METSGELAITDPRPASSADAITRRRILRTYIFACLFLAPPYAVFFALFDAWWSFGAPVAFTAATLLSLALSNRQRDRIAAQILVVSLLCAPAFCSLFTGGVYSPLMIWLTPTPFMAGAIIGRRWAVGLGGVATVFAVASVAITGFPQELTDGLGRTLLAVMATSSAIGLITFYGWATTRSHEDAQAELREQHGEISERHRDMRLVLDNVNQGFATLDTGGRIAPERSAAFDRWLGEPGEGETLWSHVAPHDPHMAALLEMGWSELRDGVMPVELTLHQMPRALQIATSTLAFEFHPFAESSEPWAGAAWVVSDITASLRAAEAEAQRAEALAMFDHFGRDPAGFGRFVAESRRLMEVVLDEGTAADIRARAIHTLKGNCALHGIASVADACGRAEDSAAEHGAPLPQALDEVAACWSHVDSQARRWGEDTGRLAVPEAELVETLRSIDDLKPRAVVRAQLVRWTEEPVEHILRDLGARAADLAVRLGKDPVDVEVAADAVRLAPSPYAPFWAALAHVVRNAADHGFESPEDRSAAGKPSGGTLRLTAELHGARLRVAIADDGAGVDWEAIRTKATENSLPADTDEDLIEALFADALSTASEVTATSGRGVGMAAVREVVGELGGRVTVDSTPGQGTTFVFDLPYVSPYSREHLKAGQAQAA